MNSVDSYESRQFHFCDLTLVNRPVLSVASLCHGTISNCSYKSRFDNYLLRSPRMIVNTSNTCHVEMELVLYI